MTQAIDQLLKALATLLCFAARCGFAILHQAYVAACGSLPLQDRLSISAPQ